METTKITSKQAFSDSISNFEKQLNELNTIISSLESQLSLVENIDEIDIESAVIKLKNNIKLLQDDFNVLLNKYQSYYNQIIDFDKYNFNSNNGENNIGNELYYYHNSSVSDKDNDTKELSNNDFENLKDVLVSIQNQQNGSSVNSGDIQQLGTNENIADDPLANPSGGQDIEDINNSDFDFGIDEGIIDNTVIGGINTGTISSNQNKSKNNIGGALFTAGIVGTLGVGTVAGASYIKKKKEQEEENN